MEELHQSFAIAPPEEIKVLADAFKAGDAGIDVLIQALSNDTLTIRVIAYQLLQLIQSDKAQQAIGKGILLNEGDRVYHVYKSGILFTDQDYLLCDGLSYTDSELANFSNFDETSNKDEQLASAIRLATYQSKSLAELVAESMHQQIMRERHLGEFTLEKRNPNFNLEAWCLANNIPYEDDPNFVYKLNSYLIKDENFELMCKFDEAQYPSFNLKAWCATNNIPYEDEEYEWDFLNRLLENIKTTENYELLSQLWKDAVGSFAFVREQIIKQKTYLK